MDYSVRISPQRIVSLSENEVFVFGSNLKGHHAGGAARQALLNFGAKYGQSVGLQGRCYAIPTKDENLNTMSVEDINLYVDEFIEYAREHPESVFLVTEIGCGIAGLSAEEVGPLFIEGCRLKNVSLPIKFWQVCEITYCKCNPPPTWGFYNVDHILCCNICTKEIITELHKKPPLHSIK